MSKEPRLAIELVKRKPKKGKDYEGYKPEDLIILKKDKLIVEHKDGVRTERQTWKKVNLTKQVNETAKLVKENAAEQRLLELKEAIEKELNGGKKK